MFSITVRHVLWASTLAVLGLCCCTALAVLGSFRPYYRVKHAMEDEVEAQLKYEEKAAQAALLEQENAELRRRLSEARR